MTINKEQLRATAEAATPSKWTTDGEKTVMSAESDQLNAGYAILECHGPDALKNAKFAAAANPSAVLGLLDEIDRLESYKTAYMEWSDKTDWVQETAAVRELGKHRADVIRERFDALKAENEELRKNRTDWQAECLKRGFEYVRESDDHYVLADVPEMADLLGALLGVEVRDRENDSYGDTVSNLTNQVDAGIDAFHRAYEAEKERDQLKAECEGLRKDAERYRWLRDGAGYSDTRDIPGMAPARMDAFIDAGIQQGGQSND